MNTNNALVTIVSSNVVLRKLAQLVLVVQCQLESTLRSDYGRSGASGCCCPSLTVWHAQIAMRRKQRPRHAVPYAASVRSHPVTANVRLKVKLLSTVNPDPIGYLGDCDVVDTSAPSVAEVAKRLAGSSDEQTARNCFEFVRDKIRHSADYKLNPVTCRASDVLRHKTGYCYAKSHLLCALLRANGIPAGLCYQRLSIDGKGPPFCLHGLNAMYLAEHGWYRVDARGNRPDVDARFKPPVEQLAFPISVDGEQDLPGVWQRPRPAVTKCLVQYDDWSDVYQNLPDVDVDP